MLKYFSFLLYPLFLLLFPISQIQAASEVKVTGDWEFTMTSQRGEMKSEMSLIQEGENLKVTMKGFRGDESKGEGKVTGTGIEWTITRTSLPGAK